ncbi:cyclophilin-like fold protein [Pseudomonas sp.]|uniref:cyclophilin-like fold protein n=1 Tax=Pseudomonas sp. TaxID=306 RepID=UPI003D13A933
MLLFAGSLLGLAACFPGNSVAQPAATPAKESPMKIRLIVDGQSATATLYDNATARDFATLLPLSLTMEDYATIERVSSLPRKLSTQGAPDGMTPVAGELTHYAPWGNLAIFIQGRSYSRSLLPLGKVEEGLPVLARPRPYQLRIERIGN